MLKLDDWRNYFNMQTLEEYIEENGGVVKASKKLGKEHTHVVRLRKKPCIVHNDELYPKLTNRKKKG